ncbi:MAG: hypothetical protein ACK45T_08320, partial [Pseudanabaena sp.]
MSAKHTPKLAKVSSLSMVLSLVVTSLMSSPSDAYQKFQPQSAQKVSQQKQIAQVFRSTYNL